MPTALKLPADSAQEQVAALLADVDAALTAAADGLLVIDAGVLQRFDSSTVALLLHAQRGAHKRGLRLQIDGAPPRLRELATLYGVAELLPLGSADPVSPPT